MERKRGTEGEKRNERDGEGERREGDFLHL